MVRPALESSKRRRHFAEAGGASPLMRERRD